MAFDLGSAQPVSGGFDLASAVPVEPLKHHASDPSLYSTSDALENAALRGAKDLTGVIARTGIDAVKGATAIPQIVGNAGVALYNKLTGSNAPSETEALSHALDPTGQFAPQSNLARFADTAAQGIAGAATGTGVGGAMAGAESPVVAGVGNSLAQAPGIQAASAITGPAAAAGTAAMGGHERAQMLAALMGSMAPGVMASAGPALLRSTLVPKMPQVANSAEWQSNPVLENMDTFAGAGTTPTVGQATEGRTARALESLIAKLPGGAGPMAAKATSQAAELGQGMEAAASGLAPNVTPQATGKAISEGLSYEPNEAIGDTKPMGFVQQFKTQQKTLYNDLDQHIPANTDVGVSNTRAALDRLNADIPGAPSLSNFFKNAKIGGISKALESDLADTAPDSVSGELPKTLPYEAVKKLRTLVGNEMADAWVGSDVSKSKWSTLYAGLSKDLEGAAKDQGPAAMQAYTRANDFTRAGMDRLSVLAPVMKAADEPEAAFAAATSGMKQGATTLRAVMQSLPEDAQKQLAATVLRQLGSAKAGLQNPEGNVFSPSTFLTNWGNLSQEARSALWDRFDPQVGDYIKNLTDVAGNLRDGSKVWSNPSGTAPAMNLKEGTIGSALAALTGHLGVAGAGLGIMGATNLGARAMTNPNFARYLAQPNAAMNISPAAIAPSLNQPDDGMTSVTGAMSKYLPGFAKGGQVDYRDTLRGLQHFDDGGRVGDPLSMDWYNTYGEGPEYQWAQPQSAATPAYYGAPMTQGPATASPQPTAAPQQQMGIPLNQLNQYGKAVGKTVSNNLPVNLSALPSTSADLSALTAANQANMGEQLAANGLDNTATTLGMNADLGGSLGDLTDAGVQAGMGATATQGADELAGTALPSMPAVAGSGLSGLGSAAGTALGGLAAGYGLYNAADNWQSGDTGGDALRGAEAGAAIGSVVPVVGTVVGGLAGGAIGALSSAFGGGKQSVADQDWRAFNKLNGNVNPASISPTDMQHIWGGGYTSNETGALKQLNAALAGTYGNQNSSDGQAWNYENFVKQAVNDAASKGTNLSGLTPAQLYSQVVQPYTASVYGDTVANSVPKGFANVVGTQAAQDAAALANGQTVSPAFKYGTGVTNPNMPAASTGALNVNQLQLARGALHMASGGGVKLPRLGALSGLHALMQHGVGGLSAGIRRDSPMSQFTHGLTRSMSLNRPLFKSGSIKQF